MLLNNTPIEKQYQNYLIKLSSDLDSINILIEKDNIIYESNFNLEYLHQHQLLRSLTTQEIIKFIVELIVFIRFIFVLLIALLVEFIFGFILPVIFGLKFSSFIITSSLIFMV